MSELALVELKKDQRLSVLTTGLDPLIAKIKEVAEGSSSDIDTTKGRKEIVSNAFAVTKTKTYLTEQINNLIDEKNKEIEPTLKIISLLKDNKKSMESQLTNLSKDTRKTVTDWEELEAERVRIEQEKLKKEKEAEEKDRDHEIANFMHDNFCRDQLEAIEAERVAEEKRLAEEVRIQKERDARIANEAKEEAEEKAKQAEKDKIDAQERVASLKKEAEEKRIQDIKDEKQRKIDAKKQKEEEAERAKQAIIDADLRAEKLADQARQDEITRQENEKLKQEEAQRKIEDNKKHVGAVRREIKEHLMATCKIDEPLAVKIVKALLKTERIKINY